MFLLDSALPAQVVAGGVEYPIRSDFRVMIGFARMIKNAETMTPEIIQQALQRFYKTSVHSSEPAMDALLRFYHCESPAGSEDSSLDTGQKPRGPSYCFDHDAKYIYAAFLEQYRIDLLAVGHLHWFKFVALFGALSETTMMHKIMGYRSMDLSGLGKHQKPFYQKMKKAYRLPMSAQDQAQVKKLEEILLGDGDLSKLV